MKVFVVRRGDSKVETSVNRALVTASPDCASSTCRSKVLPSGAASAAVAAGLGCVGACAITDGTALRAEELVLDADSVARRTQRIANPRRMATLPTRTTRL